MKHCKTTDNAYDAASNVLSRTTGGVTTTYGYDNVNRLLSESDTAGYSAVYTYDDNGNRQTSTIGGVLRTYSYDAGDKLTSITWLGGSRTFTYDVAGRTKTSTVSGVGTTTYTWNAYNRLTSLSGPGGTETYAYNGVDSRVSRTAGGVATSFKRAGAGQTSPVLSEIQGGSTSVRYMPGVYEDRGGTVTNYHSGIKNTFLQTNAAGSQTAAKRYDAFGNVLASSGTWQGRFAYGGPHGYQTDASLQLLGDRYYDPSVGRFLTRDIAKDGRNWYVYCEDNPLKYADPKGKVLVLLVLGAVALFTVLGTDNAEAPMVTDTAEDRARHRIELGNWKLKVSSIIVSFMIGYGFVKVAKLSVVLMKYPNTGGVGLKLGRGGKRIGNIDFHKWAGKDGKPVPWYKWPHYHRRPGIDLHRPWERFP